MTLDDDQTFVPRSFIELFIPPGAVKPREPWRVIAARHDLCEDMACMLTEPARTKLWELGVTEEDVLERMHRGLLTTESGVAAEEAVWITHRLAELLGWPQGAAAAAAQPR
jgi:hypothetical protein